MSKVKVRWVGDYNIMMQTKGFVGEVQRGGTFECDEDVYKNEFKSHKLYELVKEKKVKMEDK